MLFGFLVMTAFGGSSSSKKTALYKARELAKNHSFRIVSNDYNSNIKCLENLSQALNAEVYFYCKKEDPNDNSKCQTQHPVPSNWKQFKRDNVGREGESYIEHILTHNDFPDFTLFLQSDCEDKACDPTNDSGQSMEELVEKIEVCTSNYKKKDSELKFCSLGFLADTNNGSGWVSHGKNEDANTKFNFPSHNEVMDNRYKFSFRGQFAVTKEALDAVKAKFEEQLKWTQAELKKTNDPQIGHWLERYWGFIFSYAQDKRPTEEHVY